MLQRQSMIRTKTNGLAVQHHNLSSNTGPSRLKMSQYLKSNLLVCMAAWLFSLSYFSYFGADWICPSYQLPFPLVESETLSGNRQKFKSFRFHSCLIHIWSNDRYLTVIFNYHWTLSWGLIKLFWGAFQRVILSSCLLLAAHCARLSIVRFPDPHYVVGEPD